jgi:hypothetical protein
MILKSLGKSSALHSFIVNLFFIVKTSFFIFTSTFFSSKTILLHAVSHLDSTLILFFISGFIFSSLLKHPVNIREVIVITIIFFIFIFLKIKLFF